MCGLEGDTRNTHGGPGPVLDSGLSAAVTTTGGVRASSGPNLSSPAFLVKSCRCIFADVF